MLLNNKEDKITLKQQIKRLIFEHIVLGLKYFEWWRSKKMLHFTAVNMCDKDLNIQSKNELNFFLSLKKL